MEFHIQTVEDSMIDSLDFKLGSSSNYVIDRKMLQITQQVAVIMRQMLPKYYALILPQAMGG